MAVAGTLEEHAADITHFTRYLMAGALDGERRRPAHAPPPVLVGHSFGGLVAQRWDRLTHARLDISCHSSK